MLVQGSRLVPKSRTFLKLWKAPIGLTIRSDPSVHAFVEFIDTRMTDEDSTKQHESHNDNDCIGQRDDDNVESNSPPTPTPAVEMDAEQPSSSTAVVSDDDPGYKSEEFEGVTEIKHPPEKNSWNARTSFTADSPYFSAFCDSEIHSLNILCETLTEIAVRAKTFSKTGAIMCEATRRLAMACKLERPTDEEKTDEGMDEQQAKKLRRKAIGEEMAQTLELLGEVSHHSSTRTRLSIQKLHRMLNFAFRFPN